MSKLQQFPLSKGWSFRDSEETSEDAWMPVPVVPSVVHQDLQANNKYANLRSAMIGKLTILPWIQAEGSLYWIQRARGEMGQREIMDLQDCFRETGCSCWVLHCSSIRRPGHVRQGQTGRQRHPRERQHVSCSSRRCHQGSGSRG